MKSVNSLVQSLLLAVAVLWFSIDGFGLDALYGALVSFINTWLFDYFLHTQKAAVDADGQKSFRMAIKSSVLRMFSLAILALIGLGLLALDPSALILSLVVGQVGFILDRVRQK
ncbi:MAG: ATP synthase subunit I [Gammaproteobacteria bacterium]|nr:ATP synthase subunit I [Gammaproteobacteria bacterium]